MTFAEITAALEGLSEVELTRLQSEIVRVQVRRSVTRTRDAACERLALFDAGQVPESGTPREPSASGADSLGARETLGDG